MGVVSLDSALIFSEKELCSVVIDRCMGAWVFQRLPLEKLGCQMTSVKHRSDTKLPVLHNKIELQFRELISWHDHLYRECIYLSQM